MAVVDFSANTLTLSVIYFGPRGAGCGTNVRQLHRAQPTRERVELRRAGGEDKKERIWHFVHRLEAVPQVGQFESRMMVASVPSGPDLTIDREPFLAGVDGIVFVADARANRADDNFAALLDLERSLLRQGLDLEGMPLVFQVNQSDAPNARPAARVVEDLNLWGARIVEGMARQGKGVVESHDAIRALVIERLVDRVADESVPVALTHLNAAQRESGEQVVIDHATALPQLESGRRGLGAANEIVLRPPELMGHEPLGVVRAEVMGGRLRVDALMRREDGSVRKLGLLVEPGRDDGTPIPEPATETTVVASAQTPVRHAAERDLSNITYGVIGWFGGLLSGILAYYIVFG